MRNIHNLYHFLSALLQNYRKKYAITVHQLCKSSGVSTRTYTKLVKHLPIKPECYVRLVIGFCKNLDREEFLKFWMEFGKRLYEEYDEE